MTVLRNTIYENTLTMEQFRVLTTFPREDVAIVISLARKDSLPFDEKLSEINDAINEKEYTMVPDNQIILLPGQLTEKQKEKAEANWALIGDFVLNEPDCFDSKIRSTFISDTAKKTGRFRSEIQRLLYCYWAGGMTKNALIPQYQKRGGKGNHKIFGSNPLGRPVVNKNSNARLSIGDKERKQIESIIKRYYNKHTKYSLKHAYEMLISTYYCDIDTGEILPAYPTPMQFRYHAKPFIDVQKRVGSKRFNKDMRGITGSSVSEADGPGDKYQIDATVADVYLVSQIDRRQVIGRPVLYFVTDVFSRMITGFYVSVEGPSWIDAMMALHYTFMDKVELCEKFGISITPQKWPCSGLPRQLMVDNGELISKNSNNIITGLGIDVLNASSYRPDMKGIVEQSFHLLNENTKMMLPGAVLPDFRERGGSDYRMDAKLNIKEFTKIIILYILKYNNRLLSKHPQQAEDVLHDKVPPIPIKLWNWGIQNRTGRLRHVDNDAAKVALLPRGSARVTLNGIKFLNLFFTCDTALREDWFSRARYDKTHTCSIAYDPRNMEHIYILFDDGNFELCHRTQASKDYFSDLVLEEISFQKSIQSEQNAAYQRESLQDAVDFNASIQQIIENAEAEQKIVDLEPEKQKNKINMLKENRKAERNRQRAEESIPPNIPYDMDVDVANPVSEDNDDVGYSAMIAQIQKGEDRNE